ncbi:putative CAF1 family ribonuclease [Cladophialophora carrionii]|uniref:Putative CAF1 family ribonuclease n=1 Tax=Cladophialophora carrionii TaxID=86049 RepID=A0A1C1CM67_9EURO|nr:putative CAF1 family ribonuclease [Cladophialophora carrionii]
MDVNSASFPFELVKIIQHIANSRFIAFDLEFSGVAGRRAAGGANRLSLQEYYSDLRAAAQIYQILQVGLTIVTEDTEKAVSFLMRNGFGIDKPFTQGVHYLSRQEEDLVRNKLIEEEQVRSMIPDMQLRDDDSFLVDHIKKSVHDWQALPKEEQEPYLNIPAEDAKEPIPSTLNRYQVRLTHQTIRNEYPNLKTQGMGHFVQITNPTSEQQANEKELREQRRELEIANAVGFRWVLEAIMGGDISNLPHHYVVAAHSPEDKPKDVQRFLNDLQKKLKAQTRAVVGHNCLTDVINLYRCFVGDLPEKVGDFSAHLHKLFPVIMDTKFVAGLGNKRWADTSLRSVESELSSVELPQIHLPPAFDRYLYAANYHEAGFDSFVTAKIGLKMPGKLKRGPQDIKLLVEGPVPAPERKIEVEHEEDGPVSPLQSPVDEVDQKHSTKKNIVDMIKAPVTTVRSILSGAPNAVIPEKPSIASVRKSTLLIPASVIPTTGTVIATKEKAQATHNTKNELQKLRTISKKRNIFDVLDDEPEDTPAEEPEVTEQQRIADLVKEGRLMPRWEQDAEFWRLIVNKLQANATQEGILHLTEH